MNSFLIWEIILLSCIQGVAEFIPVSSSGHLVIAQKILGVREPQLLLNIVLHLGTLSAVVVFLRKEIRELLQAIKAFFFSPRQNIKNDQIKLLFQLFIASLPTALIGYFLHDPLERAFGSVKTVGGALFLTGLFLFFTRYSREKNRKSVLLHPLLIGTLQGLAIIPGLSRSGLTIGGALFLGWEREKAAKFSFLLSIPAILGAFLFEVQKGRLELQAWSILFFAFLATFLMGLFSLVFLMKIIKKGSFFAFSFYCLTFGLIVFSLSFII